MPLPRLVLTHPLLPDVVRAETRGRARVTVARTPAALARALRDADACVTLLRDRVDAEFLARAPRLRAVANFAVGLDNVDLEACRARGVRVLNTPGVLTRATAELALTLLLAAARRVPEGEALCRADAYRGWEPDHLLGHDLRGRRAVLVGEGRIGRETARLFRAVGLRTEFLTRRSTKREISAALRRADVLSFHCPLTPATRHWLSAARLRRLPRSAIVINTARGPLIDERALARALRARRIAAAGLDVHEREPRITPTLRRLPNVVLLPHVGSATPETRAAMCRLALRGAIQVCAGKRPLNQVL